MIGEMNLFGSAYLPEGTDTSKINQNSNGCGVYTDRGTGIFNFNEVNRNMLAASMEFSTYSPTLQLDANNQLTRIGATSVNSIPYDVITFNTCSGGCSSLSTGTLSVPDAIFEAIGNWNGPTGMTWPSKLIINVIYWHTYA